jgi:DNA-directed RNA polymerase specialized sigma24 family protein
MQARHDNHRTEAALYWSAVSLIVCEGLPLDEAAARLGVNSDELRELLSRRQNDCAESIDRLKMLT